MKRLDELARIAESIGEQMLDRLDHGEALVVARMIADSLQYVSTAKALEHSGRFALKLEK